MCSFLKFLLVCVYCLVEKYFMSGRNWVAYARGRLGASEAAFATVERDANVQAEFGTKCDVGLATIVTTADLTKLLPMPDDALLMRATRASLQKAEAEATALVAHVQKLLQEELASVGISFTPGLIDATEAVGLQTRGSTRQAFTPRQQITYVPVTSRLTDTAAEAVSSERARDPRFQLAVYSDDLRKRALLLDRTRRAAKERHDTLDSILESTQFHAS